MAEEPANRGDWAEEYVRDCLSLPLISEFVFHSVRRMTPPRRKWLIFSFTTLASAS